MRDPRPSSHAAARAAARVADATDATASHAARGDVGAAWDMTPARFAARLATLGYTAAEAATARAALDAGGTAVADATRVWWTLGAADPSLSVAGEPLPTLVARSGYTVVGGLVLAAIAAADPVLAAHLRSAGVDPVLALDALRPPPGARAARGDA